MLDTVIDAVTLITDISSLAITIYSHLEQNKKDEKVIYDTLNAMEAKIIYLHSLLRSYTQISNLDQEKVSRVIEDISLLVNQITRVKEELTQKKFNRDILETICDAYKKLSLVISSSKDIFSKGDEFTNSIINLNMDKSLLEVNYASLGISSLLTKQELSERVSNLEEKIILLMSENDYLRKEFERLSKSVSMQVHVEQDYNKKLAARTKYLLSVIEEKNKALQRMEKLENTIKEQKDLINRYRQYSESLKSENEKLKNLLTDKAFTTVTNALSYLKKQIETLSKENKKLRSIIKKYQEKGNNV
ncbi:MAG: hypothetical protein ACP6IU_07235 [Candidatus Asgardarchaeia archaeon]